MNDKTVAKRPKKSKANKLARQLDVVLSNAEEAVIEPEAPKALLPKPEVQRVAKDIYCVVNQTTRKAVETHFGSRSDARTLRNYHSAHSKDFFVISRGKDHPHGASF
jgi:hypothetical protein